MAGPVSHFEGSHGQQLFFAKKQEHVVLVRVGMDQTLNVYSISLFCYFIGVEKETSRS